MRGGVFKMWKTLALTGISLGLTAVVTMMHMMERKVQNTLKMMKKVKEIK